MYRNRRAWAWGRGGWQGTAAPKQVSLRFGIWRRIVWAKLGFYAGALLDACECEEALALMALRQRKKRVINLTLDFRRFSNAGRTKTAQAYVEHFDDLALFVPLPVQLVSDLTKVQAILL